MKAQTRGAKHSPHSVKYAAATGCGSWVVDDDADAGTVLFNWITCRLLQHFILLGYVSMYFGCIESWFLPKFCNECIYVA